MGQSFTPELVRLLKQAGCVFIRHGKGDHDIRHSPRSDTTFPVDHKILSRHTANGVLKQAGLAEAVLDSRRQGWRADHRLPGYRRRVPAS